MILDDTCIKFMTDGVLLKEMEQVGTAVYSVVCVRERELERTRPTKGMLARTTLTKHILHCE